MKIFHRKHPFQRKRKLRIYRVLFLILFIFMVFGNAYGAMEPGYIPFSADSASLLLQKVIETRLIPCTFEDQGLRLTVTRLLDFSMNWETERFRLGCYFLADYQGLVSMHESGEVILNGAGLLSPVEQKVGVKLLAVDSLKLDHFGTLVSEAARLVLDEGLSGKEFWWGGTPVSSEILTRDNFTTLLSVALNLQLPLTVADHALSFTLLRLDDLTLMPEPGQLQARIAVKGTYKKIMTFSFAGEAVVSLDVSLNPEAMTGLARIVEVNSLDLKGIPGFLDSLVRRLVNTGLRGRENRFILQ